MANLLGLISQLVRGIVAVVVILLALVWLLDWLVRSRRINAFSPLAQFLRQTVSPLLRPVERSVMRAGGLPSSAPLWALAFAIIGGILLITAVDFVLGQIVSTAYLASQGPKGVLAVFVQLLFFVLQAALLVRVISSWLPVSPYSPWLRWAFALSEPILRPLRQFIPNLGMFDITPLIAYFLLGFLESGIFRLFF